MGKFSGKTFSLETCFSLNLFLIIYVFLNNCFAYKDIYIYIYVCMIIMCDTMFLQNNFGFDFSIFFRQSFMKWNN